MGEGSIECRICGDRVAPGSERCPTCGTVDYAQVASPVDETGADPPPDTDARKEGGSAAPSEVETDPEPIAGEDAETVASPVVVHEAVVAPQAVALGHGPADAPAVHAVADETEPRETRPDGELPVPVYWRDADGEVRWGCIDRTGKPKIAFGYDGAGDFHEGLSCVRLGDLCGFVDGSGEPVIDPQFAFAGDFHGGLACVNIAGDLRPSQEAAALIVEGGKCGYIDRKGAMVINPRYDDARDFSEGLAAIAIGELWGYVDEQGSRVVEPQFTWIGEFHNGFALVEQEGGDAIIDASGQIVCALEVSVVSDFSEGLALVCDESRSAYGYVDQTGNLAIVPQFSSARYHSEGLAVACSPDKGKVGYIDKEGTFLIEPQFDWASEFSEGLAAVQIGREWGYVNKAGDMAIEPREGWLRAGRFRGGLAPVLVGGRVRGDRQSFVDCAGDAFAVVDREDWVVWIDTAGTEVWDSEGDVDPDVE